MLMLLMLFAFAGIVQSDSVIQTDWSGGYGVWGPVGDWSDQFDFCNLNYGLYQHGFLSLSRPYTDISFVWSTQIDDVERLDMFDIDGDIDEDLFIQAADGFGLLILENVTGPDSMQVHLISTTPRFPLCFADIDGDGLTDIVTAGAWGISWFENPGDWSSEWDIHPVGTASPCIDVEDIDGDGDLDIAGSGVNVTWWRNDDGIGNSWSSQNTGSVSIPMNVALSDVDGDGDQDIFYSANTMFFSLRWLENLDGAGLEWVDRYISTISYDGIALGIADFDQDGDEDPVGSFSASCCFTAWYRNPGGGSVWSATSMHDDYFYTTRVLIEDPDCDGDFDALAVNELYEPYISILENQSPHGNSWLNYETPIEAWDDAPYTVGDVDRDGLPEIVYYEGFGGYVVAYALGTEYAPSGYLDSSRLYLGCDPQWGYLTWEGDTPPGTEIAFQVRASDSPTIPGTWSDTLYTPSSLEGILSDGDSYLQYRVILSTTTTEETPVLHSVEIGWEALGLEVEEEALSGTVSVILPNPSPLKVVLAINLESSGIMEVFMFDITGRLVDSWMGTGVSGENSIALNASSPGLHFIQFDTPDGPYLCRTIVIN
jgi:hypothetical protein